MIIQDVDLTAILTVGILKEDWIFEEMSLYGD